MKSLFSPKPERSARPDKREGTLERQEEKVLAEFSKHFGIVFRDPNQLKLALTHRSYLSVTGQGPRESNERLEFLGDSVLGLVTSEYLYRRNPDEHEGQLTKTKSLLVSKAILSRRALRMGLGRFVLMSHSEVESGGRQRLSILADAFESVLGAIYLDQGFEASRTFIHKHLLADSDEIAADKRHTNYKSHLQEYVQSTYRTHPVYRIRSEYGPDHSKHFMVEVLVGRRTLGEGRGHNKKEAEQAAARNALENVKRLREDGPAIGESGAAPVRHDEGEGSGEGRGRRRRRGGRGRSGQSAGDTAEPRRAAGTPDAGVVEEYEAVEDAVADDFDVEVVEAEVAAGAHHAGRGAAEADEADDDEDDELDDDDDDDALDDDEDDEEIVDDLDETADDEIDDEADDDDVPVRAANPVHEELHVDPFDAGEPGPRVDPAQAERERAAAAKRTAEMEQAMDSFGQRKPEAFGRRGRPARRGR